MYKIAYLTIDDAPSEDMQRKLEFLESKSIPAIWFCEGRLLEERPQPALNAIKSGHIISNHSYDHPHFSQIAIEECFRQIDVTNNIITNLYKQAGTEWKHRFFRFPFGDQGAGDKHPSELLGKMVEFRQSIQKHLKELGYRQPQFKEITYDLYLEAGLLDNVDVYWTFDTNDWVLTEGNSRYGIKTVDDLLERMDKKPDAAGLNTGSSSEIILMHDHNEIADAFIPMIEKLLSKNIRFVLPD